MKRIAFLLTMVMLLVLLVACTEPTPETYTVNFVLKDETISQVYEVGVVPTPPTVEDYEMINQVYSFSGWDKEIVAVTEDATYTAQYTGAPKQFDVTFIYGGATTGTAVKVAWGATPTAPTTSLNYETADKIYTFIGWDKALSPVTADIVYTAEYTSVLKEFDVTFVYGDPSDPTSSTKTYKYGETPVAPTEGLVYHTTEKTYLFTAWDKTVAAVTGDVTYTAVYQETTRKYIVTLKYDGATTTIDVEYNTVPTLPTPAATYTDADAGRTYLFTGWDKTPTAVTGDDTYTAVYAILIFSENFDDEGDFTTNGATKSFGAWSFTLKSGYSIKPLAGANGNQILELHGTASAAASQIGIKDSTGLVMDGRTKLTISFDLGKKDGVALSDTYIRFRSSAGKFVKFLVTAQADNSISFCGTKLKDGEGNLIALSETLKNFTMEFDFVAGTASIAVDGVVIVADADLYNNAATGWTDAHGTDMLDYVSKCTQYVFQWAINSKTVETGLLLDNMTIYSHY